ncbi:ent-isokaurene C2/C3-hydroxylase-like [Oryza glaberrima]|uniref:Cytochrome P450 n=1 Tax=Oryza glaberrima TaxID=4538 RepID=I1QUW7_ORYGL|nr:ent-isokaurene C2/C3-hydroxylase-like [Oryza glaberrima]
MEDKLPLALTVLSVSVLIAVVISKLVSYATKPRLNLPPGPWKLPVIGSLHHLVGSHAIHRSMRALAEKHGRHHLMQISLGEVFAVVVSSPEAAEEILRNQDVTFADRFLSTTIGVITFGGNDMAFAPYGERWRQLRKLCTLELLSAARVRSFRRIREEEVARLVRDLAASAAAGEAVNLSGRIAKLINDVVVRCCVGGRSEHRDEFLDALRTALDQTTWLTVADVFPSSKLARMLGTAPRKALASRKKIEHILEQIIQERKRIMDRSSHGGDGDGEAMNTSECFLDVLLRLQKDGNTPIPITNEVIVVLLFDMFSGGSETSSSTLIWTMAELIRKPKVMAKAHVEVRQAFQGKNTITEDDGVNELTYLKMVIKESLRMHCPVPLLGPRKCRETCKVMGYDIPKDTTVFVNAWAICRDPKYWDDAEEFQPERFENKSIDYKGTNFEFLPFGSGRRMCAAMNLGIANVELPLASLLYHFDWKLPVGMMPEDVDMQDAPGILVGKRSSLIMCPVTRVAPSNPQVIAS